MRYPSIPSSLFADRRKNFTDKMLPGSVAVFYSNESMSRSGDTHFPFRQDSFLFSMSGLDQPGSILLFYRGANKKTIREMAFILPQDLEHAIWHGARYSTREAKRVSGISHIYTLDQWDAVSASLFDSATCIYIPAAHPDETNAHLLSHYDRMAEKLRDRYPSHTFADARQILQQQMMIKHPVEIELIQSAISVTGKAFDRVLHTLKPGMKEYEVEAELTYVLAKSGCQHAFEPIVAAGKSACTLHYVRNDRTIKKDELVLIDFGAEYACMASDMTRTIPASGIFSKRQKAIYHAVWNVLKEVTEMMRPGVTLDQLNKEAGKLIDHQLVKLKIFTRQDLKRQDPKTPLRRQYFMHGIGHHLGYDVHDLSNRTDPLKPGMVITCEPGLYIKEENIGIRLENDILITRGSPKNLMEDIPIHPEEIETMMQRRPIK